MADANVVVQSSDRIATAIDLISGWFTFGALVLVEGGACFALLCLLPALRRAGQDGLLLSATLNRRFAVLTMLCATAGGGAALLSLVAKAEIATALPPATLVSIGRLGPMLTSPAGHAWLGREFIFVGLLVVAVVAHRLFEMANVTDWSDKVDQHHADRRQPWHAVVTSLDSTDLTFVLIAELAAAGLLFQAMDSHLAAGMVARHGPLGIVALCCHLLAAGLWVGGLAYGAIFLWPIWRRLTPPVQTAIAGHAVARFSPIALSSVMVITISGTYAAVLLVPAPSDLLTSAYGQALDVKVALLLVLVLFGAANRRTLASIACATHPGGRHTAGLGQRLSRLFPHREAVRQLSATVSTAGTRLIRSIRREFLVAAAALLAAATMLEVGPPNAMPVPQLRPLEAAVAPASIPEAPPPVRPTPSPAASPVPPSYASSAKSGDLTLSLRADPTLAGATSTITVHVASDNGAPTIDAQVKLWLTAQTLDMGTQVLTAKPAAQGMYQVVAPAFAAPGNWQVLLVVRRDNVPEVDQRFIIPVQAPSPNTAAARQATNTPVPNPMREALAR